MYKTAYRLIGGFITLGAVVAQYLYSSQVQDFNVVNFFSLFTILSSIFAGIFFISSPSNDVLRGANVLYLITTCVVYTLLLSGLKDQFLPWVNFVLHYLTPAVVLLDWFLVPPKSKLKFSTIVIWLGFPLMYFIYSEVRGGVTNWYPYPFLNPATAGYQGVLIYFVAILLWMVILSKMIIWIGNSRR